MGKPKLVFKNTSIEQYKKCFEAVQTENKNQLLDALDKLSKPELETLAYLIDDSGNNLLTMLEEKNFHKDLLIKMLLNPAYQMQPNLSELILLSDLFPEEVEPDLPLGNITNSTLLTRRKHPETTFSHRGGGTVKQPSTDTPYKATEPSTFRFPESKKPS